MTNGCRSSQVKKREHVDPSKFAMVGDISYAINGP